ncbi:MAG: DUF3238 domain-containing protein [Halobacteriota archaeon]
MANLVVLRFVGFIPRHKDFDWIFYLYNPLTGSRTYFKGDQREFTPYTRNTLNYRTAQEIWVDFQNRKFTHWENIGITHKKTVYPDGRVAFESAQASRSCIKVLWAYFSDNYCQFRSTASCTNPLAPVAPASDYDFTVTVYRNGTVHIQGSHDGFPAYEVYKNIDNSPKWIEIYRHDPRRTGENQYDLAPPMDHDIDKWG